MGMSIESPRYERERLQETGRGQNRPLRGNPSWLTKRLTLQKCFVVEEGGVALRKGW